MSDEQTGEPLSWSCTGALAEEWSMELDAHPTPALSDLPKFLNLGQACAWLATRDLRAIPTIDALQRDSRGGGETFHVFYFTYAPQQELSRYCQSGGEGLAFGRKDGGELTPIPSEAWDNADLLHHQGDWSLAPVKWWDPVASSRSVWSEVRFERDRLLQVWPGESGSSPNTVLPEDRPSLPARATKNDLAHEEAAHAAAKLVSENGITIEVACGKVCHLAKGLDNRAPASVNRAIRQAYNLMYDRHGRPRAD